MFRIRPQLLFVIILLQLTGFSVGAKADLIEVSCDYIADIYKLDVSEGELGDLTVYLKSFGDEMDGYAVYLLDDLDRAVASEKSTAVGIVRFTGIPAGRYRIRVESRRSTRGVRDPVTVGDMKLVKVPGIVKQKDIIKTESKDLK